MFNCFSGTIYLTSDLSIVQNNINRCKVLMVTNDPILEGHCNRVSATILLPPTQAIIADADDDMQTFQSIYYQYLISDEVTEFLSIVFLVLHRGVNVLLYIPAEDIKSLDYVSYLLGFIFNNYGIQIGTDQVPFVFNPNYEGMICDMLYLNNLIDYKDLIMSFPVSCMSDMTLITLNTEIHPYATATSTPKELRSYFMEYQNRTMSRGKFLTSVISYGKKEDVCY